MHTPIFPIATSHMSVQLVGILSGDFTLFHSHSRNASFRPRWTRSLATLSIRMAGMADDRVNGLSRRSGELDIFTWATSLDLCVAGHGGPAIVFQLSNTDINPHF